MLRSEISYLRLWFEGLCGSESSFVDSLCKTSARAIASSLIIITKTNHFCFPQLLLSPVLTTLPLPTSFICHQSEASLSASAAGAPQIGFSVVCLKRILQWARGSSLTPLVEPKRNFLHFDPRSCLSSCNFLWAGLDRNLNDSCLEELQHLW